MQLNPAEIAQTLEVLGTFAKILNSLGVPGLVALGLSGPVLVLIAVIVTEFKRARIAEQTAVAMREESRALVEIYRSGTQQLLETYRKDMQQLLETYRADTQSIVRQLGDNQGKTDQYYRDNVQLVQQYEHMAKNLQDVAVSNTRVIERLTTMLEERRHL